MVYSSIVWMNISNLRDDGHYSISYKCDLNPLYSLLKEYITYLMKYVSLFVIGRVGVRYILLLLEIYVYHQYVLHNFIYYIRIITIYLIHKLYNNLIYHRLLEECGTHPMQYLHS